MSQRNTVKATAARKIDNTTKKRFCFWWNDNERLRGQFGLLDIRVK